MILNIKNICDINKINLHDSLINEVIYTHSKKIITINLEGEWGKDYVLKFYDVLYYEMTCCDFWGRGYNVVCWSKIDATGIFDKLLRLEMVENSRSRDTNQELMDLFEFFGIEILINSGDKLKIICKSVEVNEI